MNTRVLLQRLYGAEISDFEVVSLPQDASNRRYHRVTIRGDFSPEQLMIMELPEDALKSDEVTTGDVPDELPFLNVQRHMAAANLPVPEIYLDAVGDGAVLLEDLGDDLLVRRIDLNDPEGMERWYCAAVDLMARMHDTMWPVPEGCLAATRTFDFDLLRWELDHYREWGAEALEDRVLAGDLRASLDEAFDELAGEIARLPRGFVHRDYQSRNLLTRGADPTADNLCIIDFQDALEGPRVYDLVALLNDSYVDVPHDMQRRLIGRYADRRSLQATTLENEFDLITVQRKLKDGGRFVFIDRVKGNPNFLPFIDKSFGRVKAALRRLEGHEKLKAALALVDPVRFGGLQ